MNGDIASFRRDDRPEGVCLVVAGELDESNSEELYDALVRLVAEARSPTIIDLTGVTFFSSAGISGLISAQARAEIRHVDLVVEPSWAVRRLLDITGLTSNFNLRPAA